MTLFDKLQAAVTDTVIDYRSDLDHDRRALESYPGRPFLHFARPSGTNIVFLTPADAEAWPLPGERVPFLFGTADRWHILKEMAGLVPHHAEQAATIHYFDGRTLRRTNQQSAEHIAADWRERIEQAWTNPTPELATTLAMRAVEQQEAQQ